MTPLRSLPLLALAALAACSSAAPTPAPPPSPSASATGPVGSSEPTSGWTPHDPRIVRCGIDDRPRNVVSRLGDEATLPRLKMEMPPPPPPPPPPVAGARPKPPPGGIVLVDRAAPQEFFEPPMVSPTPPLRIEALPLTNPAGGPVPTLVSSADPHYEICTSLAAPDEVPGSLTFGLELASSGAPLRVLPPSGSATPTPLVRCFMERACQLHASAPGQKTLLDVPLRVSREQPPPPPPPAAVVRVDVASENPRADVAELQLQLRSAATSVMQACGPVPGRARVRLSLDLVTPGRGRPGVRRSRNLRIMMPPPPETTITGQRTEVLEGTVSSAVLGCVVNGIRQRTFSQLLAGPRTEKMMLTWNP